MLNSRLPVDTYREAFAREGRVLIESVLDPAAAEDLYQCLLREIPWELVFRRGDETVTMTAPELERLSGMDAARMTAAIQDQASRTFQFVYWKYSLVDSYRRRALPHLLTHRLLESLASRETIELVRRITGFDDVARVDAQATWYRPGNFLTAHSDEQKNQLTRRAAYVIQLCRDWRADWGGLLHFLDDRGRVRGTITPGFNSMALFAVPQQHAVSMVAPFTPTARFGITGWFTAEPAAR